MLGFLAYFFNRMPKYVGIVQANQGWLASFVYMRVRTVKDSADGHVFRVGALIESCQLCQAGSLHRSLSMGAVTC